MTSLRGIAYGRQRALAKPKEEERGKEREVTFRRVWRPFANT
ncbi:hypothetical protein [Thaumasiovibrio subtropicus]|nr:hypothetical protein [Thaumasiovibrio subtropicus]